MLVLVISDIGGLEHFVGLGHGGIGATQWTGRRWDLIRLGARAGTELSFGRRGHSGFARFRHCSIVEEPQLLADAQNDAIFQQTEARGGMIKILRLSQRPMISLMLTRR